MNYIQFLKMLVNKGFEPINTTLQNFIISKKHAFLHLYIPVGLR